MKRDAWVLFLLTAAAISASFAEVADPSLSSSPGNDIANDTAIADAIAVDAVPTDTTSIDTASISTVSVDTASIDTTSTNTVSVDTADSSTAGNALPESAEDAGKETSGDNVAAKHFSDNADDDCDCEPELFEAAADTTALRVRPLLVSREYEYRRQTRLAIAMMILIAAALATSQSWNPR